MTLQGLAFAAYAIPLTLAIITILVLAHECGHFITARLFNIRVLEFGIGFPPRARVLAHGDETQYTLNYLPIGGFVLLEGEEADSADPRAFGNARLWRQLVVLAAGVVMNVVLAVVLFFVVAWFFDPAQGVKIGRLTPGGAADRAGLVAGESIDSVNGQRYGLLAGESILDAISADAGKNVAIGYVDLQGVHRAVNLTLGTDASVGILGIRSVDDQHSLEAVVTYTQNDPVTAAGKALDQTAIHNASIPVYANVTAEPVTAAAEIRDLLFRQLTTPVRWEQTVRNMVRDGATHFVEIGPGKVLQGLVKRTEPGVTTAGVDKFADIATLETAR